MMVPTMADGRDYRPALAGICFSWLYSVAWTVPPLLGWSKYGPEGPGTTCSVDWRTQTANNISYIICLFIFCLVLPFTVILYSYGKLLFAIRQVQSSVVARRREQRVLVMVVTMVVGYLVCWLPYGVAALLATFGSRDLLTPEATITPSLLAKFSTVINPFIYIFMNKQLHETWTFCRHHWDGAGASHHAVMEGREKVVMNEKDGRTQRTKDRKGKGKVVFNLLKFYRCFRAFLRCSIPERGSSMKTFSRATKSLRPIRQEKEIHISVQGPSTAAPSPNSIHRSSQAADHSAPSNRDSAVSRPPAADSLKPKLILVAHYRE